MNLIINYLIERLTQAVAACTADGIVPETKISVRLDPPKNPSHGDFATNAALMLAKAANKPPRELAQAILDRMDDPNQWLESVEVAGPGFLNLRLSHKVWHRGLGRILEQGSNWGRGAPKSHPRINLEFVSANPTGPLHVGHGRGAAVGDSLVRILRFAGFDAQAEYYLNDAGRQVKNLGRSVWIRSLEILKHRRPELDPEGQAFAWLEVPPLGEDDYHGDYIVDLAKDLVDERGSELTKLKETDLTAVSAAAVEKLRERIQATLEDFGVHFDIWASEKALHDRGAIQSALETLEQAGHIYEKEGAKWFASSRFGDEKDRVVVRADGQTTYFAADIAYHMDKFERGFDVLIDLWGADHHGYVPRVKAAIQALGRDPDSFEPLLVQFVSLMRGGEKVAMGKRSGTFVTVDDLLEEVGKDVMRYFFLERRHDSHIDFDMEVAVSQDPTVNPAVYVQYGHARACGILRKAREDLGIEVPDFDVDLASLLTLDQEIEIIKKMLELPQVVEDAAANRQPHRIAAYLLDLSRRFQSYYTQTKSDPIIPPASKRREGLDDWDWDRTKARLMAVRALKMVFANCLHMLGLSAPERMESLDERQEVKEV